MKKVALALVVGCLAAPAFAGGIVQATIPESSIPVVYEEDANWSGNYAGLLLGYGKMKRNGDSENGFAGALTVGRMHDFGAWVGAIEIMAAPGFDAEVSGREVRWGAGVRTKVGKKFGADGRWLAFGSVGIGRVKTEDSESGESRNTNGYIYGIGVSHLLNDDMSISAEWLSAEKNGAGDAHANGVALGVAYKF